MRENITGLLRVTAGPTSSHKISFNFEHLVYPVQVHSGNQEALKKTAHCIFSTLEIVVYFK